MMRMTNRKIYIGLALFLMLMVSFTLFTRRSHRYYVNVFESEGGWGYDILYNNKTIIHQPFIPAVDGQKPFSTKLLAEKTSRLVINKLRINKSPRLTAGEINSIYGITNSRSPSIMR
jgi:hypothetical protein